MIPNVHSVLGTVHFFMREGGLVGFGGVTKKKSALKGAHVERNKEKGGVT